MDIEKIFENDEDYIEIRESYMRRLQITPKTLSTMPKIFLLFVSLLSLKIIQGKWKSEIILGMFEGIKKEIHVKN